MEKIKLAVVEDQQLFRQGLLALLKEFPEMDVVIEAENGKDFMMQVKRNVPQVVILDLEMPEMDGFETTSYINQRYPSVKIIILTQHNSEEFIHKLIKRGAHGFLLKNNDIEIIVDAIYAVIGNGYYFNEKISKSVVKGLMFKRKISPRFKKVFLTEKELEILELVCKENTNIQIADKLAIDTKTVETHKRNIIIKTNSKNIIGAVMYAVNNNLVEEMAEDDPNGEGDQ